MSAERDFVEAHRDLLHADLDAWLRIPSISADPAHARGRPAQRRVAGRAPSARDGFPTVEVWETPGRAGRLRRVARGRAGRAGGAGLRPPRRAAGRPAGAVDAPAVRADRRAARSCSPAAPPTTRASCCSTCSGCGRTSPPPAATPPRSPCASSSRARRSPARRTSPRCWPSAGTGSPRRRRRHRHRRVRPGRADHHASACAGWSAARSTSTARTSTCTPARSAARCPTR